jgi:methionine-rich copper-binding protein CopC
VKGLCTVKYVLMWLVLAGSVVGASSTAQAWTHAELVSSTPADGATLATAPASATLTFTDAIATEFVRVAVTSPVGARTVQAAPQGHTVTVPITSVGPGPYRVAYRVVSADGHPVSGAITFTVSGTPTATSTVPMTSEPITSVSSVAAVPSVSTVSVGSGGGSFGGGSSVLVIGVTLAAVVVSVGGFVAAVRKRRP